MEPYFIKLHKTHYLEGFGYNMTYGGEGTTGPKSGETRKRMSESAKGKRPNEGTRKKMSEWQIGRVMPEETRKRMSESAKGKKKSEESILKRAKNYLITFPDSHEEEIINMCEFCRNNNLSSSHMFAIAAGNRKSHKGFKCIQI